MGNPNRVLTGTNGFVWLNGRLLAHVLKIELKVTGSFEEMSFCGDPATYQRYTGWSGEGTVSLQKLDSAVLELLAEGYQKDQMPEIKIITKLTDPATGQSERAAVEQVVFTEFMLPSFEKKALVEEEIPLKFAKYQVLERIGG